MGHRTAMTKVGIARQTDWDTAASAEQFLIPWRDISPSLGPEYVQDDGNRGVNSKVFAVYPNVYRPELRIGSYLYPDVAPLIYGSILGSISTSGTGPYTHTTSPADDVIPLTAFTRFDAAQRKLRGFVPRAVEITWSGEGGFVEMSVEGNYLEATSLSGSPSVSISSIPPFIGKGQSLKIDGNTVSCKIISGRIRVEREIDLQWSSGAYPCVITPDVIDATGEITVVFDSEDDLNRALTSDPSNVEVSLEFTHGGTTYIATYKIPKLIWGGNPVEIDLGAPTSLLKYSWQAIHDTGINGPIQVVFQNSTASY